MKEADGMEERLEDEGVKLLIGIPNVKIHARSFSLFLCLIKRGSTISPSITGSSAPATHGKDRPGIWSPLSAHLDGI